MDMRIGWQWLIAVFRCATRPRRRQSIEPGPRRVGQIMGARPPTLPFHYSLAKVLRLFQINRDSHFYVIDPDDRLAGRIACRDLDGPLRRESLGTVLIAGEVCLPVPNAAYADDDLAHCLALFAACAEDELPVLASPERPHLVGVVSRWRLLESLAGGSGSPAVDALDGPAAPPSTRRASLTLARGRVIPFARAAELSRLVSGRAARRSRAEQA